MESRIQSLMRAHGQNDTATRAFLHSYLRLVEGDTGCLPEATLEPAATLPRLDDTPAGPGGPALLDRTVLIKLNGGLGTGMGLDRAKSLLPVKDGHSFLDLISRQVLHFRAHGAPRLRFLLMNSAHTADDTRAHLARHPGLGDPATLDFLQSSVPKIDAATLAPASYPATPDLAWCPPGHGDVYASLAGSGKLDELLAAGIRYAFVSNSDNLGAIPDPRLLQLMEDNGWAFLMEVTRRTAADRKGGHLARRREDGRLVLRESAQCPPEDEAAFQDIRRHAFFNTNNLWLRLDRLRQELDRHGGALPLPLIRNRKTLDPRDPASPPVYQLETAMGAAISLFPDAAAVEVPRSRFAPVKTTADLLVLRSDACELRPDWTAGLVAQRHGVPPEVALSAHYRKIDDFDALVRTVPSLLLCDRLTVDGPVRFDAPATLEGTVTLRNPSQQPRPLPPAIFRDSKITL